jgi:hypothetical protein
LREVFPEAPKIALLTASPTSLMTGIQDSLLSSLLSSRTNFHFFVVRETAGELSAANNFRASTTTSSFAFEEDSSLIVRLFVEVFVDIVTKIDVFYFTGGVTAVKETLVKELLRCRAG